MNFALMSNGHHSVLVKEDQKENHNTHSVKSLEAEGFHIIDTIEAESWLDALLEVTT